MKRPLVLCIMDGFGIRKETEGNAITAANTPNLNEYIKRFPKTLIGASGMNVGLPEGQMGNSEVGHTNIGAGRIVYQELTRISKSITDGDFFENQSFLDAIENCKANNSTLHLMGLLSDGGVHSHNTHLYALLELAKKKGLEKVFVHCIMDGRDVPPTSGKNFVSELQNKLNEIGIGKIATVTGRYYAMDRDNRFERVSKSYNNFVLGDGIYNENPVDAIENSYNQIDADGKHLTDEFIMPIICDKNGLIGSGDSVIFFNFRPDRAREITRTFVDENFTGFERVKGFFPLFYVCMTRYDATMPNVNIAFKPQSLNNTLGEYLSRNHKTQLRIAETEKYAHVTFFFNGGVETVFEGEDRILVPSPKVSTYDLKPEMSAYEVTEKVVESINSDKYDVIILNYANCDMVGHTGVFDAAVKAVESVDVCVVKVVNATVSKGGVVLLTADHGNADRMYDTDGSPFTAHTTNPVPFIVVGMNCELKDNGNLCDIAPTMLKILDMPQPPEMTGKSIIK